MAQFIAFDTNVEVNGQTVLAIVNALPEYIRNIGVALLERNGISAPTRDSWHKQQNWLSCFKEISDKFGNATLFEIGKNIPANADFPPEIDTLEKALRSIDVAYHMNHRNGEIGYYKVVAFDDKNNSAIMECKNPYPCHFDKGIITAMTRRYLPKGYTKVTVELDFNKKNRTDGADSSWYNIKWE